MNFFQEYQTSKCDKLFTELSAHIDEILVELQAIKALSPGTLDRIRAKVSNDQQSF
jgi:hypothetical protein